jgi:hypothetical protein
MVSTKKKTLVTILGAWIATIASVAVIADAGESGARAAAKAPAMRWGACRF